jgi:hypothetical protein
VRMTNSLSGGLTDFFFVCFRGMTGILAPVMP